MGRAVARARRHALRIHEVAAASVTARKEAGSRAEVDTFDLDAHVVTALKRKDIGFAVDQQPYLQGYLGVDSLWLYKTNANVLGGGKPVFTGPAIVTKDTVAQIEEYAKRKGFEIAEAERWLGPYLDYDPT